MPDDCGLIYNQLAISRFRQTADHIDFQVGQAEVPRSRALPERPQQVRLVTKVLPAQAARLAAANGKDASMPAPRPALVQLQQSAGHLQAAASCETVARDTAGAPALQQPAARQSTRPADCSTIRQAALQQAAPQQPKEQAQQQDTEMAEAAAVPAAAAAHVTEQPAAWVAGPSAATAALPPKAPARPRPVPQTAARQALPTPAAAGIAAVGEVGATSEAAARSVVTHEEIQAVLEQVSVYVQ